MKKQIVSIIASLALLAGCSTSKTTSATPTPSATADTTNFTLLAPTGAPGYGVIPLAKDDNFKLTLTDGADALQAAFVSPDTSYDFIVAPTNLGVKLIDAGKADYSLAGIITTGNLYVVAENEDVLSGNGTIALFGENAVPGLVYNQVKPTTTMSEQWFNAVTDAQAALLSGQADAALLAEPAATATIAKAKEAGKTLTKVADLQKLWGENGYPMASLFVKNETLKNHEEAVKNVITELKDYADQVKASKVDVASDLDSLANASDFGSVPSAMVAKTYAAMGINPDFASNHKEDIQKFLDVFQITLKDESVVEFK